MKRTLLIAVAAAVVGLGTSAANAFSVDVIWQNSGTATTTVSPSATITADIFVTTDGGTASLFVVSALASGGVDVQSGGLGTPFFNAPGGAFWSPFGPGIGATTPGIGGSVANYSFGASGSDSSTGIAIQVGTITVHAAGAGLVTPLYLNVADGLVRGASGYTLVPASQITFTPGVVNLVPEPGTMALLGLGLGALAFAGRRR